MRKTTRNRYESAVRSTRRGRHAAAAGLRRAICEVIEPRIMLSATLGSQITASITPSSIPESLFSPGMSTSDFSTSATTGVITSASYRFSLNTTSAVTFNTSQVSSSGYSDVAMALYDGSGNLLQSQFTAGTGTSPVQTVSATLSAGQVYELIAYVEKTSGTGTHTIALTANTGSQAIADTIAVNPATDSGSLTTSAAPDAFTGPTSVRYFPVNFLDAGQNASVAISAAGPDTSVYAALYQQTISGGTYTQVTSGTGLPTLSLSNPSYPNGSDYTDYNYLLAVSPLNLIAPAEAFKATVSTTSPLLPATVSSSPNTGSFTPVVSTPGTVSTTYSANSSSTVSTVGVTAVVTGPMTVTGSAAVFGVYSPTGTSLLGVGTGQTPVTFNAVAGQTYIVGSSNYGNSTPVNNYSITASQSYVSTTALSAGSTAVALANVQLEPSTSGYQLFTITPAAGADYLLLQVAGSSQQSLSVNVAGPILPAETVASGTTGAFVAINLDTYPGAVDVMVLGNAAGTATLTYGTITVPKQLKVGQLPAASLSTLSGALSTTSTATPGSLLGVQYQQLPQAEAAGTTTVSTSLSGGVGIGGIMLPGPIGGVLIHYVQAGNILNLTASTPVAGGSSASLTLPAIDTGLNAVAVIPFGTSTSGTLTTTVAGPAPAAVGVAMVPNVLPGQTASTFYSKFQVSNGTLSSGNPFDLWQTNAPFNLTSSPGTETTTLRFSPNDINGPLQATVTLLSITNGSSTVLASGTNNAGQLLSLTAAISPGAVLRILVQPVAGTSLGSGSYSLYFQLSTTDPRGYLVSEPAFYPYSSTQSSLDAYLPNGLSIQSIPFGSDATASFNSNIPYSNNGTGSIEMFSVTVPAATPFEVYTVDTTATINTDIQLYTYASGVYTQLSSVSNFNQDYYPADRSTVDAKIVVNNYDLVTGLSTSPQTIYAVVMNEQGTEGNYQIWATANPQSPVGPGSTTGSTDLIATPNAASTDIEPSTFSFYAPPLPFPSQPYAQYKLSTFGSLASYIQNPDNSELTLKFTVPQGSPEIIVRAYTYTNLPTPTLDLLDTEYATVNGTTETVQVIGNTTLFGNEYLDFFSAGYTSPITGTVSAVAPPLPTSSGPVPALTTTNVPGISSQPSSALFTRLEPAPDGTISQTNYISGGTGTVFSDIFTVLTPGSVTLHTTFPSGSTNVDIGLYEMGVYLTRSGFLSVPNPIGALFDYDNVVDIDTSGEYSLTEVLPVGTYMLTAAGTVPTQTFHGVPLPQPVTVTGTIPAFTAIPLSINPSTDGVDVPAENIVDAGAGQLNYNLYQYEDFGTYYYEVTIPANSTGSPFTVTVNDDDLQGDDNITTGTDNGYISGSIWKVNGPALTGTGATGDTYTPEGLGYNMFTSTTATQPQQGKVTELDNPVPGTQYLIGLDLNGFVNPAFISVTMTPYSSAVADLVVSPIKLTPDNGHTLVTLSVKNNSYGFAAPAPSAFDFTNINPPAGDLGTPAIDALSTYYVSYVWTPAAPSNVVTYTANSPQTITEINYNNNSATVVLSSVDPHIPTASIALSDTAMTGESSGSASAGGGTWGRYVSGVTGQTTNVVVTGNDVDGDLFNVNLVPAGSAAGSAGINGSSGVTYAADFGKLSPTSSSNPNLFNFSATDAYGLTTGTLTEKTDVVALPHYLTGGTIPMGFGGEAGSITFSASTHQYSLKFEYAVVNYNQSLSTLLNTSIPLIGDKTNELLIAISGTGTTGLNPANNIAASLSGQIVLEVLSESIYNKTFSTYSPIKNLTFRAGMVLSGQTLEPTGDATVSAILSSTNLEHYESPLIPIFSIGIPGVAAVEAGFKFGIDVNLSAGAKIGLNLAGVPGATDFGIMSPTFIQPIIKANAQVSGQLTVLGFDAADVSGGITLTLTITLGLDNSNPGAVFSPGDALDNLSLNVAASLGITLSATVLGFNVFSYNPTIPIGSIGDIQHGIFLTDPPSTASGSFIPPTNGPGISSPDLSPDDLPTATTYGGTMAIGSYSIDPPPQLVIDPTSANAISAQITNVGTANAPTGNLTVATRTGGTWSGSTVLSDAGNVTSPQLALTHDSSGKSAAVLVYDVDDTAGSPVTQTRNTFLDSNDIRYRYYNGTTWSAEQSVTSDSLDDSGPSVAFNANGVGVMAYVHNSDSSPDNSSGSFDAASDDIRACIWNPTTHTWSSPLSITSNDGVADSTPSAFVDSSGNIYVVWVRGSGAGNELAYSMYNSTTGWSAAAALPITGLPTGGQFSDVAVSASASGRVDVAFSYDVNNADGSVTSTLYDRPTTIAGFTASATVVQIATGANYTGLRLTGAPSGSLVAYWGQSDGVVNQVFESTLASPTSAWTTPMQLTDDPNVATEPTAAVDTNGTLQVLYDNVVPYGSTSAGNPTDPSVGAPTVSGVASSSVANLPQLGFSSGLDFGYQTTAPTGSSVTGQATIINRGLVSAPVTISAIDGGTVFATQSITLAPGATYTVSQSFLVLAGTQTYSLQLSTPGGQAFDTTENLSSATLTGASDVAAVSLTPSDPNPVPGEAITLTGTIQNSGGTSVGPFTVALDSGDPLSPQYTVTTLATQNVTSLAGNATDPLYFNVTLPAGAGADVYTLVIDPSDSLTQATRADKEVRYEVDFSADPSVVAQTVVATLQNSSGVNNVTVTATVTNLGTANLSSFPVDLSDSFNGAAYNTAASPVTVPALAAGASYTVSFTASGIAGDNEYEVFVDPSVTGLSNTNVTDDFATTDLVIQGLPTLVATFSLPTSAVAGAPLTLTANLSNTGIADADNVLLEVLASLNYGGTPVVIGSTTVPVSSALSSQNVSIPLTTSALSAGAYTITLEVDPDLQILQGSRAGATATATLNLTAPLILTGATELIRSDPSFGSSGYIDVYTSGTETLVYLPNVSSIIVAAPNGSQSLTVDYTYGDPIPAGGLSDTGPTGGANTLTIVGTTLYSHVSVGASTITDTNSSAQTTDTISYSNLTGIYVDAPSAGFNLTQTAQPGGGAGLYYVSPTNADSLTVQAGQFTFLASNAGSGINSINLASLYIGTGATVSLSPPNGTANRTLLVLGHLTISGSTGAWTGKLDLSGNDMDVQFGSLPLIYNQLTTGYNAGNGFWNGAGGILSSAAANNPSRLTTLAAIPNQTSTGSIVYGSGNPAPFNLFDTYSPSPTSILVKYTYFGDANLDGVVNGLDYTRIDNGYQNHLTGWYNGDFNYDGVVNGSDYTLIDNTFNRQGAALSAEIANLEPAPAAATVTSIATFNQSGAPRANAIAKPASLIMGLENLSNGRTLEGSKESTIDTPLPTGYKGAAAAKRSPAAVPGTGSAVDALADGPLASPVRSPFSQRLIAVP